jgi:glycosyltransferase involved in cell wall biosynthesis
MKAIRKHSKPFVYLAILPLRSASGAAMQNVVSSEERTESRGKMVIGVTSHQTCLVMTSRLRALKDAGFEITLISSPGTHLFECAEQAGVTACPVKMARTIALFSDLLSLFALWRVLRQIRPQVVEFSTPKAGLLGLMAAMLARVPHRVYLLRGLKLETAHGFKRGMLLMAEQASAFCSHLVLCNSDSLKSKAVAVGIARADKIVVLGDGSSTGIDLLRFKPGRSKVRGEFGIAAKVQVIGFVGRITRDKGILELLEAFEMVQKRFPETFLLLVGWFDAAEDAVGREVVERIATDPRIRATGYVHDTAPYYRAMDLMVLPSRREGFPNVILEAAATGLPVVSTLCTGSRDAVVPEVTGLLVEPENPPALADALCKLLADAKRRAEMGSAARRWVKQHFSMDRVLSEHVVFYKKIMGAEHDELAKAPGIELEFIEEPMSPLN